MRNLNTTEMNESSGAFARESVERWNGGHLILLTNREDGSECWAWEVQGDVVATLEIGGWR